MIEADELVYQTGEIQEVDVGHPLDLPTDEVALSIPPFVPGRTLEEQMVWMDIDFDGPADVGNREVDADPPAVRKHQVRDLWNDGDVACSQRIAQHHFWMRFSRTTVATFDKTSHEPQRPRTARVAEASSDRRELGHRAVPVAEQLLDDRGVVLNRQHRSQIEGQS